MKKNRKPKLKIFSANKLIIFLFIALLLSSGGGGYLILKNRKAVSAVGIGDGTSTIPRVTSNLISTMSGSSNISLAWSNPFPVSERLNTNNGFKIERSLSIKTGYSEIASLAATEESYLDTTTTMDVIYYYRTYSFTQDNVSSYSNVTTPTKTVRKDVLAVDGQFEQSAATNFIGGVGWSTGGEVYYDNVSLTGGSIINGDFENDLTSWNPVASTGSISVENSIVYAGTKAAKLSLPALDSSNLTRIESIASVTAGSAYTLSFWTRTKDGVNGGRYGVVNSSNGTDIISVRSTGVVVMTYTQVSIKFTAPAGCGAILIKLYAPGANRGDNGSREPVANDTVGDLWQKVTDYSVLYDDDVKPIHDNTEFNIIDDPENIGNHLQTMSVTQNTQNPIPARFSQNLYYTQIWRTLTHRVNAVATSDFEPGQTYEFKIDKISLLNTDELTSGRVEYWLYINDTSLKFTPTATPTSITQNYTVPMGYDADRTTIQIRLCIFLFDDTGSYKPNLAFDDVHFYPKDAEGNYLTEQVPAPRDRNINTAMVFFEPGAMKAYDIATRFDQIMLGWPYQYMVPVFRRYNPNAKIFYYHPAPGITEMRKETTGEYLPYGVSLIEDAFSAPPDGSPGELYADRWFAKYPGGAAMAVGDQRLASDIPIFENYVIGTNYNPPSYEVKIDDPDYQRILIGKLTPFLENIGADGVFFDVLNDTVNYQDYEDDSISAVKEAYRASAYQVQSFQNYVFPRLRASGFEVMQNACCRSSLLFPGQAYLDPNFQVSDLPVAVDIDYDARLDPDTSGRWVETRSLYTNNTPDMIATYWFDEWAFWNHEDGGGNNYTQTVKGKNRWKATLDDLDERVLINNTLPRNQRKMITLTVNGVDITADPQDPAAGINGWRNFGLASYMLAKSEYSLLGNTELLNGKEGYPMPLDMSRSNLLGEPMESRNKNASAEYSDETLQSRVYSRGIAVANGSPTLTRNYTVPEDVLDENDNLLAAGTVVTLPAHSGRIYLFSAAQRTIAITAGKSVSYGTHYVVSGTKNAATRNIEAEFDGKKYYATVTPTTWSITLDTASSGIKLFSAYDVDFPKNDTQKQIAISKRKVGDINDDGAVNSADLVALISGWNTGTPDPTSTSDFNEDGRVDQTDFSGMMFYWDQ